MKNNIARHINCKILYFFALFFLGLTHTGYSQESELVKDDKNKSVTKTDTLAILKEPPLLKLNGRDGPYLVNDTLYRVNAKNKLIRIDNYDTDSLVVRADNKDDNEFFLSLKSDYSIPESTYDLPQKMVVISDIEGKYDAFASFLYSNKVIDENHNWIFGEGHLVLVGDFVDRGKNVTQVLWLIYKLEHQALLQNGQVHFILGNHEVLNFQGNHRYNRDKYIRVAQKISGFQNKTEALKFMYSEHSEIGKWLATKNVVEKIGDYIFVHAGLSPELLDYKLTLEDINALVRSKFRGLTAGDNETVDFLYGSKGPFWYRGLVMNRPNYSKIDKPSLDKILRYYESKKIVIGHTIVDGISTDFDEKVIRIDVSHGLSKFTGKTKGILIENGEEFIIDDKENKSTLSTSN